MIRRLRRKGVENLPVSGGGRWQKLAEKNRRSTDDLPEGYVQYEREGAHRGNVGERAEAGDVAPNRDWCSGCRGEAKGIGRGGAWASDVRYSEKDRLVVVATRRGHSRGSGKGDDCYDL